MKQCLVHTRELWWFTTAIKSNKDGFGGECLGGCGDGVGHWGLVWWSKLTTFWGGRMAEVTIAFSLE